MTRRGQCVAVLMSVVLVSTTLSTGAIGAPDDPLAATFDQTAGSRVETIELDPDATPSDISVALSQATGQVLPVSEVLIARDNDFADALASGGLQDTRPLLLVPDNAGLPSDVARAYATPGEPTSGFADALSAGALAAESGWPILSTDGDQLASATAAFLVDSNVEEILVVGGTAAISAGVEAELSALAPVRRLASGDRFGTAVEVAKESDRATDGDIQRLTLIEGTDAQAWVGGFAAASGSALRDAPVVLAADTPT